MAAEIFFVEPKNIIHTAHKKCIERGNAEMIEKMDKQHIQELKKMIQEKEPQESVEKVLITFCARHAVSLDTCRKHYEKMVAKGEVKEK